jgi:hypothetical protein
VAGETMAVGPAPRRRPRRAHAGWLRHLLFALSLLVVALSVVGMHQLSVGHEVATSQTGHHAHTGDGARDVHTDEMAVSVVEASEAAEHVSAAAGGGVAGDACPDCGEHQMLFGSCLLALSLLVLSWMLAPPRLRQLPPFLLPRLASARLGPVLGRVVPPLSLTELSLRRT